MYLDRMFKHGRNQNAIVWALTVSQLDGLGGLLQAIGQICGIGLITGLV